MSVAFEQQYTPEQIQQVMADNELFRATLGFSQDMLFRMDLKEMTIKFIGNMEANIDENVTMIEFLGNIMEDDLLYQQDRNTLLTAFHEMSRGIIKPVRFRMKAQDGRYDWYMAEYTLTYDENGEPASALGKIRNVQKDRDLADKANLDLLTSCLNKGTFESYATSLLSDTTSGEHAFFIIDVDNFKAINDNLGHFFGDIVLKEIAGKLKKIFRESDYIGRIGGDEFGVIMRNVVDGKLVAQKAKEILSNMDTQYKGNGKTYRTSGSIGISLFPQDGQDYQTIYQNADLALYHSKGLGKNAYTAYNNNLSKGTMANTTPFDAANRALAQYFDQEVAMDSFNLLFEDENHDSSVERVLRHLGERFQVDRCYVFELAEDSLDLYNNTHEWCGKGVSSQKDELQNIPFETFDNLFREANEEGVYYCNEIDGIEDPEARKTLQDQGIKAILHTYIKRNGHVNYVIGFDDCRSERVWKPNEISTLLYASKIITQFLAYKRALSGAYDKMQENLHVLDSLNFYAYIVDYNDHTLSYYNNKTAEVIPGIQLAQPCYTQIRGLSQECPDCPIRELREKNAKRVRMVVHNKNLDLFVLVTASRLISYDGKESVFVSSTKLNDEFKQIVENHPDLSAFTVFD